VLENQHGLLMGDRSVAILVGKQLSDAPSCERGGFSRSVPGQSPTVLGTVTHCAGTLYAKPASRVVLSEHILPIPYAA
jgi:hypothetical protein